MFEPAVMMWYFVESFGRKRWFIPAYVSIMTVTYSFCIYDECCRKSEIPDD